MSGLGLGLGSAVSSSSLSFQSTLINVLSALVVALLFVAFCIVAITWVRDLLTDGHYPLVDYDPPVVSDGQDIIYDDFEVEADLFGDDIYEDDEDIEHPLTFVEDGIFYDYSEYDSGFQEVEGLADGSYIPNSAYEYSDYPAPLFGNSREEWY